MHYLDYHFEHQNSVAISIHWWENVWNISSRFSNSFKYRLYFRKAFVNSHPTLFSLYSSIILYANANLRKPGILEILECVVLKRFNLLTN